MKKIISVTLFAICGLNTISSEWSYKNQKDWYMQTGKMQSPINIPTKSAIDAKVYSNLVLDYKNDVKEEIENNGHSIEIVSKGKAVLNKRDFDLLAVHSHSPSEHTYDSKYYPLELHFVHKATDGRLGVVGVVAQEGKENPEFQKMLDGIKPGHAEIDLNKMLPSEGTYYHYLGSLTTPPLTENVEWYLLKTPITLSKKQIEEYNRYYNGNNRELQELNDRPILIHNMK